MIRKANAYARVGVDVDVEAKASRIMFEASKKTFKNRTGLIGEIVMPFRDFAALKMISIEKLPRGSFLSMGFDTAGTKVEIAQRMGKHDTIAFDFLQWFATTPSCAAANRSSSAVIWISNRSAVTIDSCQSCDNLPPDMSRRQRLETSPSSTAKSHRWARSSVAEGNFPYHWGAACVWVARKEKIFTGAEIKKGDAIVMLREYGFSHSVHARAIYFSEKIRR